MAKTKPKTIRVGQALRAARESLGLSQAGLARRLNRSQTHVSRLERDERSPTIPVLCRIADALEMDFAYDGARIVFRRREPATPQMKG